MNDNQNRYSHVRIVPPHQARVVVHWRYAPVNVRNELMNVDERLNNGAWVDEYYYFYPDAVGIRKVTWQHDTLGDQQIEQVVDLAVATKDRVTVAKRSRSDKWILRGGFTHGVRQS